MPSIVEDESSTQSQSSLSPPPYPRRYSIYIGTVFMLAALMISSNRDLVVFNAAATLKYTTPHRRGGCPPPILDYREVVSKEDDESQINCGADRSQVHPQASYRNKPELFMSPSVLSSTRSPQGPKFNVLVTGAAGFVGMHTCLSLKRDLGMPTVVGYDNVNEYYDVSLKESRIRELEKNDIPLIRHDVCDADKLADTISRYNITRIVHLAAQAGVRYSLEQPLAYTRSNIDCTVVLLETMVKMNMTNDALIYASSSSVYGLNTKVPFHETDPVDNPASLYAATKRSDELLAQTYFNLRGIPSIGLRFFTVYGPYGRPDMAPWIFTERIVRGDPIRMFNHGKSERDFTYIDDIVNGTVQSLFANVHDSAEIINLGNGHPVVLREFVETVQDLLNVTADIHSVPMQPGDVPTTFADIEKARYMLGYNPQTPFEEGMRKFIEWYKSYRSV